MSILATKIERPRDASDEANAAAAAAATAAVAAGRTLRIRATQLLLLLCEGASPSDVGALSTVIEPTALRQRLRLEYAPNPALPPTYSPAHPADHHQANPALSAI